MLTVEDVLSELSGEGDKGEKGLPPGFRFHPTDEELLTFYLASKVFVHGRAAATATTGILQYPDTWHSYPHPAAPGCIVIMAEVDLNRCEPWELPEAARMGEREWYFFSLRDRKYPSGLRTNRATGAGYWKATGKDRKVHSGAELIGMKKTLVFYKGRAPRGVKTRWVMHEYRLDGHFYPHYLPPSPKEEWVICRIFHKLEQNSLLSSRDRLPVSSPLPANSLPPLLEETTPTPPLPSLSRNDNSNFLINNQTWELPHHQLDQKSLFDPLNFSSLPNPFVPMNATHPAFPSTTTSAPSMTFMRSLLPSHQQQLPKQCKIETNLSHFQLSPDPTWLHKITHHDNPSPQRAHHFPLNFGSDCGLYALTGGTAAVAPQTKVDMSTSLAFDRLLGSDCSIKVAGESWPLDP